MTQKRLLRMNRIDSNSLVNDTNIFLGVMEEFEENIVHVGVGDY